MGNGIRIIAAALMTVLGVCAAIAGTVSGQAVDENGASVKVNGKPTRVSLIGPGYDDDFRDAVDHDFSMGWLGNQFRVQVKP